MLDTHIDRVRVDRLRTFLDERKAEAEQERLEALDVDHIAAAMEATKKIEAYDDVHRYLDGRSSTEDPAERIEIVE
ncbi:hypothetical protein [Halobellus marinus]|jgi:hypothetical protein|uniref:hypothetical protein n=1 Tax=Halobellus TaxID=1073986 RepID=UPI0028AD6FF1|nr:hypothetical protein [Halobellus sp. DFY28]